MVVSDPVCVRYTPGMPVMFPQRVFVYGTLRRGGRNHRLLQGASLLGFWTTPARYTLVDLGGCPGARPGGNASVRGEVYAVSRRQLMFLDRLEAYPRVYGRELVASPFGGAWMYVYRRPGRAPVIAGGDWVRARTEQMRAAVFL